MINMLPLTEARQHTQYRLIPQRVLESLYRYIYESQPVGHFLSAVLQNNLFEAVGRADKESLAALGELVIFIHMEVRSDCYGSPEKVQRWLELKTKTYDAEHK